MEYLHSPWMVWLVATVQVAGLVSAWLARRSAGSRRQISCERLFLACLVLIGLAMMLSLFLGPAFWMSSGVTLAIMVLAAIWDFEPAANIHERVFDHSF